MNRPVTVVPLVQGIIQLGVVFMQMAPIAFSLAGEEESSSSKSLSVCWHDILVHENRS